MNKVLLALACLLISINVYAKKINIELLEGPITEKTVKYLGGLACRNFDKVVHLKINVDVKNAYAENEDYERLILSDDNYEYLFTKGSYFWLHGGWVIDGYFIIKSGGVHQGIVSASFQQIKEETVLLNPNVSEKRIKRSSCS